MVINMELFSCMCCNLEIPNTELDINGRVVQLFETLQDFIQLEGGGGERDLPLPPSMQSSAVLA